MDTNSIIRALIHDMIAVPQHNDININSEHITMLEGGNTARNSSNVRRGHTARKSAVIPRRQHRALGLHTLPKTAVTYLDATKIHRVWKRYVREALGIESGDVLPTVYEKGHDSICQALMKIDLHGAQIKVLESKCETLVGLIGVVVLETKNIFKIVSTDDRLRSIPKHDSVFCITIGNIEVVAYGKQLLTRSAERSVKKIKAVFDPSSLD
ncbi:PREDICTED: ribonuclease P protein subunit p29 [Bactrocera latifrons]|uniref:Ribonuclease P protein subunit p29 n=1 Tax=Bactrocera latifrons TaxID=174628 RepID=A0A0K8VQN8_BACLA|nr:PREDICTED: ribonuclease P protein subunit p29 [Bactrocera latifrons]